MDVVNSTGIEGLLSSPITRDTAERLFWSVEHSPADRAIAEQRTELYRVRPSRELWEFFMQSNRYGIDPLVTMSTVQTHFTDFAKTGQRKTGTLAAVIDYMFKPANKKPFARRSNPQKRLLSWFERQGHAIFEQDPFVLHYFNFRQEEYHQLQEADSPVPKPNSSRKRWEYYQDEKAPTSEPRPEPIRRKRFSQDDFIGLHPIQHLQDVTPTNRTFGEEFGLWLDIEPDKKFGTLIPGSSGIPYMSAGGKYRSAVWVPQEWIESVAKLNNRQLRALAPTYKDQPRVDMMHLGYVILSIARSNSFAVPRPNGRPYTPLLGLEQLFTFVNPSGYGGPMILRPELQRTRVPTGAVIL